MKQLKATVVKVESIRPHINADHLDIIQIKGQQTVVGKGEFQGGDLAVWIPAGLVVPQRPEYRFLWYGYFSGRPTDFLNYVPVEYRTIRPRKFRGEWSTGLLMPLRYDPQLLLFAYAYRSSPLCLEYVHQGQDVTAMCGITNPNKIVNRDELRQAGLALLKAGLHRGHELGYRDAQKDLIYLCSYSVIDLH